LRSASIKALFGSRDASHHAVAQQALGTMLSSLDPDEVCAALRLVHDHKVKEFLPVVLERLQEADGAVRREALTCLAAFDDEEARQQLWKALSEPAMAHVAVRALSTYGEAIVPELLSRLAAVETPRPVRLHLLRALGMIPSSTAVPTLIEYLKKGDR